MVIDIDEESIYDSNFLNNDDINIIFNEGDNYVWIIWISSYISLY